MKTWLWFLATFIGFGIMIGAYASRFQPDRKTPWILGTIVMGPFPAEEVPTPFPVIPARVRLLPASDAVELLLKTTATSAPDRARELEPLLRDKLIQVDLAQLGSEAAMLQSGRFPKADDEIIAGHSSKDHQELMVGNLRLNVVGVFKQDVGLFTHAYIIRTSESSAKLFPDKNSSVHDARLISLKLEPEADKKIVEFLEKTYPEPKFVRHIPSPTLHRKTFSAYMFGTLVFLLGGTGSFISIFRILADRIRPRWLALPLQEMGRRPRFVWGAHLIYFGLYIAGSLLIYEFPEIQNFFVTTVRDQIASRKGPLGFAGQAYGTGNVPRAAAATFTVNFFLGTLAQISIPSAIIPGIGVMLAIIRAFVWGLLLAPSFVMTAALMLPHSWTLLLEGEGYIVATIFAALIPIHLVQTSLGGTFWKRYRNVLVLNLQGLTIAAIILIIAAIYEAYEVILLAG